jgi:PAS domain S-box-containing protein
VRPKNKSITALKGERGFPRKSGAAGQVTLDGRQYLAGIDLDFTEPSRMEEALRESEERFKSLFENAVLGIYRTTPDGQILLANPALCRMLRCRSLQELQERNLEKDGFHPAYPRTSYKSEIEKKGVIIGLEASWTTADGRKLFVRESARAIRDANGKVLYYEGTVEDITERKRTEEALRESEERLRLAIQAGRMYAFEWDPATDIITRSAESREVLGLGRDAFLDSGKRFLSTVFPEDRERFRQVACEVTADNPSYQISYRVIRPEGHMIWLEEAGRAFFTEAGKLVRVVGIAANITDRKRTEQSVLELGGRLLNAQEDERRQVALELHDDIGQELAVLAVQIHGLTTRNLRTQIADLQAKIDEISSKVSSLSRQLHSSYLDHLGLAVAAEAFCREFSRQFELTVDYVGRDVPRQLSPSIDLAFYRVLQEALHNVVKHSQATHVRVKLTCGGDELKLTVQDNGVGFDSDQSRLGTGLGLISMRERMHHIGARLHVSSRPKNGTLIEASISICSANLDHPSSQAPSSRTPPAA